MLRLNFLWRTNYSDPDYFACGLVHVWGIVKYSDPEYFAFVLFFVKQPIFRVIKLFVFLIQLLISTKEVLGV